MVRRVARTTATAVAVGVVFVVASLTALVVSKDPGPLVVSFFALAVSALQFWRAELRGPVVTVLVMDSPAMDIETPSTHGHEQYQATVRQPVVVENVGGHPCALATFRIPGDLIKVSGWGEEHLRIEDGLGGPWDNPRPVILEPRSPVLFTAAWTLRVPAEEGRPLKLREWLSKSGVGEPARHADLVYSEAGSTMRKHVRIEVSQRAVREAVEQLVVASEGGEVSAPIRSRDPISIDFTEVREPTPKDQHPR